MSRSHAVRSGFSAVLRRPAAFAAELAWRWTFGAAALLLLIYGILLFLSSTPVSDRDLLGLAGIIPGSARSAIAHIASGSWPRLLVLIFSTLLGLSFLWWLASAFGRAAVLQELLVEPKLLGAAALRRVFQLQLIRTAVAVIAVLAYLAAFGFAVRAASASQVPANGKTSGADFATFYLVFFPLAILIGWIWSTLNWYLSFAPIIALREGVSAFASISSAIKLAFRNVRQFFWTGFVFGGMRFVITLVFLSFAMTTLGIFAQLSGGLAIAVIFLVFLCYCAVSDLLGVARLAAYARIVEWDSAPEASIIVPTKGDFEGNLGGSIPESV